MNATTGAGSTVAGSSAGSSKASSMRSATQSPKLVSKRRISVSSPISSTAALPTSWARQPGASPMPAQNKPVVALLPLGDRRRHLRVGRGRGGAEVDQVVRHARQRAGRAGGRHGDLDHPRRHRVGVGLEQPAAVDLLGHRLVVVPADHEVRTVGAERLEQSGVLLRVEMGERDHHLGAGAPQLGRRAPRRRLRVLDGGDVLRMGRADRQAEQPDAHAAAGHQGGGQQVVRRHPRPAVVAGDEGDVGAEPVEGRLLDAPVESVGVGELALVEFVVAEGDEHARVEGRRDRRRGGSSRRPSGRRRTCGWGRTGRGNRRRGGRGGPGSAARPRRAACAAGRARRACRRPRPRCGRRR